jgi:hypothetical protein
LDNEKRERDEIVKRKGKGEVFVKKMEIRYIK